MTMLTVDTITNQQIKDYLRECARAHDMAMALLCAKALGKRPEDASPEARAKVVDAINARDADRAKAVQDEAEYEARLRAQRERNDRRFAREGEIQAKYKAIRKADDDALYSGRISGPERADRLVASDAAMMAELDAAGDAS